MLGSAPPLPGIIGFHIQGERTLRTPDITHWTEASYGIGTVTSAGATTSHDRTLGYIAVMPLGATYWFDRTAYIDFGVGLGLGLGLAPSFEATRTSGSTTESVNYEGGASFLAEARITGRFWFSRYIALTAHGGMRIYQPTLTAAGEPDVKAELVSLTGTFGVTWAIGGTSGLGRSYIQVLPPEKISPRKSPAPVSTPASAADTPEADHSGKE